jgi:hypothetical protein
MSTCAVCSKVIRTGLLMCAHHWRMVPADQQQRVYKSYARFTRASARDMPAWGKARTEYEAARDAAVAHVNSAGRVLDTLASVTTHHHPEGASL